MSLYSGPLDSVLAPLSLLGPLGDLPLPGFASHIAIELWEDMEDSSEECKTGSDSEASQDIGRTAKGNADADEPADGSHKPAAAPEAREQRFRVRLTYDGKLVETSSACPGGMCTLDEFLDNVEAKATTDCKAEAEAGGSVPTWDMDASCCKDA